MKSLRNTALGLALCVTGVTAAVAGELTLATVNNGHMIEMQALTPDFEAVNPGITVKWVNQMKTRCAAGSPPTSPPRVASSIS